MTFIEFLQGKKTYVISFLLCLVALVRVLTGEIGFFDFVASPDFIILLNGVGLATLRAGVSRLE